MRASLKEAFVTFRPKRAFARLKTKAGRSSAPLSIGDRAEHGKALGGHGEAGIDKRELAPQLALTARAKLSCISSRRSRSSGENTPASSSVRGRRWSDAPRTIRCFMLRRRLRSKSPAETRSSDTGMNVDIIF